MSEKISLMGMTLSELQDLCVENSLPKFAAKQIADWIYKKYVASIDEMTNLSIKNRELLNEKYIVGLVANSELQVSKDGTKKYLFKVNKDDYIETVMIPDKERRTVCVSTQVGCKRACKFCMTARQGFQADLSPNQIINQILSIDEKDEVSNIVFMGMGEPFDNAEALYKSLEILTSDWGCAMSPRRITVSTIGIIEEISRFLETSECHLAISLHTPFANERRKIMPIQNKYPLDKIIDTIKAADISNQRKISFEYIVFKGFNDTEDHANELRKLLRGMKCKVNLIRFHKIPGFKYYSPDYTQMVEFKELLESKGILCTIRSSRGQDIMAACGLLSTRAHLNLNTNDE